MVYVIPSKESPWINEAYRTITFTQPVQYQGNEEFVKWFTDNAKPLILTKGTIIYMDLDGNGNKPYRVLEDYLKGEYVKCLGMSDISTSQEYYADSPAVNTPIGGYTVVKYQGSDLDTYLDTTWYNTLSTEAKSAIVLQPIVQDAWVSTDLSITDNRVGTETAGERRAYALSVQDIVDYLNISPSNMTDVNLWKMFWNTETQSAEGNFWLRSATVETGYDNFAYVVGTDGYISSMISYNPNSVRPAFTIDLSKISYTL